LPFQDELTSINVKQGFQTTPPIQNEYGSSRNANITANKFGAFFSAVIAKKQELNTFQDSQRKKPLANTKDNMLLATPRTKLAVDCWFKDLTNGTKSLTQLTRKVPFFNKKEEIFVQLNEFGVPMSKAIWFIKMSSAYSLAISESGNKSKKRQPPDQCSEWTQVLCKFLRDLYQRLWEHYNGTGATSLSNGNAISSSINSSTGPPSGFSSNISNSINPLAGSAGQVSFEVLYKNWQYSTQLAQSLFEEGLLDKNEFLYWLIDLIEKVKSPEEIMLRILLPIILQYIDELTQSELLSRRLAYYVCKKIGQLVNDYTPGQSNGTASSPSSPVDKTKADQKGGNKMSSTGLHHNSENSYALHLAAAFRELLTCHHHKSIFLMFGSIVQIITMQCPTALVWHQVCDAKPGSVYSGSPLDHLPCPPHLLPMPKRPQNDRLRAKIRRSEQEIAARSAMIEKRWCTDRGGQEQLPGQLTSRLLKCLDELDRHAFDRLDSSNSLDTLYLKIYGDLPFNDEVCNDKQIVRLLCEWAVTTKRSGEHRALAVAKLLERRQTDITAEKEGQDQADDHKMNGNVSEEKNSMEEQNDCVDGSPAPLFQNLLMSFLDTQAPTYDENNSSIECKLAFSNLVLLFAELIRCEVFSHDAYMCTLISRGQFINTPSLTTSNLDTIKLEKAAQSEPLLSGLVGGSSVHSGSSSVFPNLPSTKSMDLKESSLPMFDPVGDMDGHPMDMDDARIDADLDKLLQHIKEGQQNMNDHGGNFQELGNFTLKQLLKHCALILYLLIFIN
jgi:mediator of RNA polymerase II transcription subunit 12